MKFDDISTTRVLGVALVMEILDVHDRDTNMRLFRHPIVLLKLVNIDTCKCHRSEPSLSRLRCARGCVWPASRDLGSDEDAFLIIVSKNPAEHNSSFSQAHLTFGLG